jgi:hypothetical protein
MTILFEVLNILDRPGGKIVNDKDFVAALNVRIGQMRSDKPGASSD